MTYRHSWRVWVATVLIGAGLVLEVTWNPPDACGGKKSMPYVGVSTR